HLAVLPQERAVLALGRDGHPDDLPLIVDAVGITGFAAQRAQIDYLAVAPEERMTLSAYRIGAPDDLPGGIEGVGFTALAAQCAQVGEEIGLADIMTYRDAQNTGSSHRYDQCGETT